MLRLVLFLALIGSAADAGGFVTARTLPAGTLIGVSDLVWDDEAAGALQDDALILGRQARIALYQGRPIRATDIAAPTLVKRNQIVPVLYRSGPLTIQTEARALSDGAAGEVIKALNVSSRNTIFATVLPDGRLAITGDTQ